MFIPFDKLLTIKNVSIITLGYHCHIKLFIREICLEYSDSLPLDFIILPNDSINPIFEHRFKDFDKVDVKEVNVEHHKRKMGYSINYKVLFPHLEVLPHLKKRINRMISYLNSMDKTILFIRIPHREKNPFNNWYDKVFKELMDINITDCKSWDQGEFHKIMQKNFPNLNYSILETVVLPREQLKKLDINKGQVLSAKSLTEHLEYDIA